MYREEPDKTPYNRKRIIKYILFSLFLRLESIFDGIDIKIG